MATAAALKVSYPEFVRTDTALIDAKLAEAALSCDPLVWGSRTDEAIMLTAAHLLAISPWGQQAKLSARDGSSVYQKRLEDITPQVAHGYGLI